MRNTFPPATLKYRAWSLTLSQHTRGAAEGVAHYAYARGRGARWVARMEIVPCSVADGLTNRAWLHSLRGRAGTFYLTTRAANAQTAAQGQAILAAEAAEGASEMSLTITANGGALQPGTFALITTTIGDQLVQVATVSGGTVSFRPRLRASVAVSSLVKFGVVQAEFRLAGAVPKIPFRLDHAESWQLEIEEAY